MPTDKVAYYMIEQELTEYCQKLTSFPPSPYWIHESVVSNFIGIPTGQSTHGQADALTALLACIKDGYGGSKKKKSVTATGISAVDLRIQDNDLHVCYQKFGRTELFKGGTLLDGDGFLRQPRWFHLGTEFPLLVKQQLQIVNQLTGTCDPGPIDDDDPAIIPLYQIRRRQKQFKYFFEGDKQGGIGYSNYDIPAIAAKFIDIWEGVVMSSDKVRRRSFDPSDLDFVESDFKCMLVVSNIVGKLTMGGDIMNSISTRASHVRTNVRTRPPSNQASLDQSNDSTTSTLHATPQRMNQRTTLPSNNQEIGEHLRKKNLLCTTEDGMIQWDKVTELASLELLFHLHMREDIAWDSLESEMKKMGVDLPITFDPNELCTMSKTNINNVRKNISEARTDWELHMGGKMMIHPYPTELLYEWDQAANAFTQGHRVEANNFELNPENRMPQFSTAAKWILRHIFFSYNLSIGKVGALWACFYALIMRRPIPKEYFLSESSIWRNIMSLWKTDKTIQTKQFKKNICKKTKHGFQVYTYFSADDSKHHNRNRHVCLLSTFQDDGLDYINVPFQPSFRLITTSPSEVKSENYQKNADDIIHTLGDIETAAYVNGGLNDNANDAQKEIFDTIEEIQKRVDATNDEDLINRMNFINGVRRRPIRCGDPYHWGSLGCMHGSWGMSGDTVNGEHEQIHHRQLLMSMHSLHTDKRDFSQAMMDRVMEGTNHDRILLKTWRERQQRWLVNQRYAAYILKLLVVYTSSGIVCLVAWAMYFANFARSDWKRRVGKEIATWISMPAIILGLTFEAELGNYFEQAYAWHNRTGPFHTRSGFRMMEIHDYFWNFELPWWQTANDNPRLVMPKTMEYLEHNFTGDELVTRRKQIMRGLEMGRDEICKIVKRYLFRAPLLLLLLTHREYGASFLRAVLSVLHEHKDKVPFDVVLIQDVGEAWGTYIYDDSTNRPEEEQRWYNLLTVDKTAINDLIHFWRQFCLNWHCVTEDLQKLSKEYYDPNQVQDDNVIPPVIFQQKYPVLFECLYAVFGAMMSNSRLAEQIHGMMRASLRSQIGMDQADHQRQHAAHTDYSMREERRAIGDGSSGSRDERKKARKHDKTKDQVVMLGQQVIDRSAQFVEEESHLGKDEITTVSEIDKMGRRHQDKQNLQQQISNEDAKASRLTRVQLTIDAVKLLASKTKPTNDASFTFDAVVLLWRERVKEMAKVSFWDALKPNNEYKHMWKLARKAMLHMDSLLLRRKVKDKRYQWRPVKGKNDRKYTHPQRKSVDALAYYNYGEDGNSYYAQGSLYDTITSKAKAKVHISEYLGMVREVTKHIYSYIKHKDKGGFDNKSVKKEDILFLFIHNVDGAFGEDVIDPAEKAVAEACRVVDPHFKHTVLEDDIVDADDNDDVENDVGDVNVGFELEGGEDIE